MTFPPTDFLDLTQTAHVELFTDIANVWEALPKIAPYLAKNLQPANHGTLIGRPYIGENVFIGRGTKIEHGATIKGPAWIGENCEIRSGAYIRENVIAGNNCVLGNSCEFKNSVLFNGVQVPHFNYVGDSILGHKTHLGAGVILSNVRLDQKNIAISTGEDRIDTGLRKFGAILGDHAEAGCNAVLNPGSLLGRNSLVYPGAQWRGFLPANRIAKIEQVIEIVERK